MEQARVAVYAVFTLAGVLFASFASRIPQVKSTLDLTPGELGLTLLGGTVGIGTVLFAVTVGPNTQFWLERLDLGHPPGFEPSVDVEVDPDATLAGS